VGKTYERLLPRVNGRSPRISVPEKANGNRSSPERGSYVL